MMAGMRVGKIGLLTFASAFILFWVIVGTNSAEAARMDCAFGSCGFGVAVDSATTSLTASSWSGVVEATVYNNAGTYSYVYSFTLDAGSASGIALTQIGPNAFDPSLGFGLVTDQTTSPYQVQFGFAATFEVTYDNADGLILDAGNTLTFYAKSPLEPGLIGTIIGTGDDGEQDKGKTLAPVPEPSSLLLMASVIPGLAGVLLRKRRKLLAARGAE